MRKGVGDRCTVGPLSLDGLVLELSILLELARPWRGRCRYENWTVTSGTGGQVLWGIMASLL